MKMQLEDGLKKIGFEVCDECENCEYGEKKCTHRLVQMIGEILFEIVKDEVDGTPSIVALETPHEFHPELFDTVEEAVKYIFNIMNEAHG